MKRLLIIFLICSILLGCTSEEVSKKSITIDSENYYGTSSNEKELWDHTIDDYLKSDLWIKRDIYDASQVLMVPLHYAFQSGDRELIADFQEHFDRFIRDGINTINITEDSNRLNALMYYYLLSEYIVLAKSKSVREDENIHFLANYLLEEISELWSEIPAWQWGREPFDGGMRERILWKLDNKEVDYSYYRSIIDEELYLMAIASDLKSYFDDDEEVLDDIQGVNYLIFKTESYFDDKGKWLFQRGVWSEHPDYAYVGYESKNIINGKKTIATISADSSHFHRFPLWIESFINSYPKETEERNYFIKIKKGLEKQFFEKVLIRPDEKTPFYRLTNFMDGTNGLYRWDYSTIKDNGYGPYELSGTFTLGWWTFLGSERIKEVYLELSQQYPLSEEAIDLYVGPNTSRERNSYVTEPDSYDNGFKKLLAMLASKIE